MITEKTCTRCGEEKPVDCFSRKNVTKDGLNPHCRECNKEYMKNWLETNRLRKQAADRDYTHVNRESIAKKKKEYYQKNISAFRDKRSEYLSKNAVKVRKRKQQEYLQYRDSYIQRAAWRRAKKLQSTPIWLTMYQKAEIRDFYTATKMFQIYTGTEYHVDHIVPLQGETVCGLHVPWNLQILPWNENLSKQNRHWPDMPE